MASPPWAVVKVQVTIYVKRLAFGDCSSGLNNTYLTGSFQGANDALKGRFPPTPSGSLNWGAMSCVSQESPRDGGPACSPRGKVGGALQETHGHVALAGGEGLGC